MYLIIFSKEGKSWPWHSHGQTGAGQLVQQTSGTTSAWPRSNLETQTYISCKVKQNKKIKVIRKNPKNYCLTWNYKKFFSKSDISPVTLRGDVRATALGCQVILQLFYLLPVLLQLHLKLLDQAVEITKHRKNVQYFHLGSIYEVIKSEQSD